MPSHISLNLETRLLLLLQTRTWTGEKIFPLPGFSDLAIFLRTPLFFAFILLVWRLSHPFLKFTNSSPEKLRQTSEKWQVENPGRDGRQAVSTRLVENRGATLDKFSRRPTTKFRTSQTKHKQHTRTHTRSEKGVKFFRVRTGKCLREENPASFPPSDSLLVASPGGKSEADDDGDHVVRWKMKTKPGGGKTAFPLCTAAGLCTVWVPILVRFSRVFSGDGVRAARNVGGKWEGRAVLPVGRKLKKRGLISV